MKGEGFIVKGEEFIRKDHREFSRATSTIPWTGSAFVLRRKTDVVLASAILDVR